MTGARLWEAISLRRGSLFSDTLVQNMLWAILVKLTGMANKNNQGEGFEYAPRVKMAAALPVEGRVLACLGWAGQTTDFFEHSLTLTMRGSSGAFIGF